MLDDRADGERDTWVWPRQIYGSDGRVRHLMTVDGVGVVAAITTAYRRSGRSDGPASGSSVDELSAHAKRTSSRALEVLVAARKEAPYLIRVCRASNLRLA